MPRVAWHQGWTNYAPHLCLAACFIGVLMGPIDSGSEILPLAYRAIHCCVNAVACDSQLETNSRHTFAAVFLQLGGLAQLLHTMYHESPDDPDAFALCECLVRTAW